MKKFTSIFIIAICLTAFAATKPKKPPAFSSLDEHYRVVSLSWSQAPNAISYRIYESPCQVNYSKVDNRGRAINTPEEKHWRLVTNTVLTCAVLRIDPKRFYSVKAVDTEGREYGEGVSPVLMVSH